jgi:DTW domain-containing protein YfiP
MPPLALSHRLWVVTHCKEVLRTTATGKLLLLAHPRATLLVSGLPAHDEELEQLCRQPTTAVLYPSPDALTPAALLERVARIPATASPASGASGSSASEQQPSSTGRVPPSPCLDIVLLDGTWNQVRQIFRTLPDAVPKVVISPKAGSERSVFGTAVRKQGKAREEAGRISTIEAYAQQRRST